MKINFVHAQRDLNKITTQWCRTCKTDKPTSAFYPCHRTMCMDCKKTRKRKALRECVTDLCHSCGKWKPQSQFDINSRGDRVMSTCAVCTKKKKEAREKKNLTTISLHELKSQQPEKVEVKRDLWYLWKGTVHLFIVGPSEFAMHRCTEPAYSGRIGTDEERAIAKMAIKKLNDDLVNNFDKGPEIIKKALNEARAEYEKQKHTHKNE